LVRNRFFAVRGFGRLEVTRDRARRKPNRDRQRNRIAVSGAIDRRAESGDRKCLELSGASAGAAVCGVTEQVGRRGADL